VIVSLILVISLGFVERSKAEVELSPEHTFEAGMTIDICVDRATGYPHVIWEGASGSIRYSQYTGSDWTNPITVPGPMNVGCFEGEPPVRAPDEISLSMGIDSSGYLHIAYITNNTTIYHLHQTAGGWSTPVLVHDGGTYRLSWVNLAIDSQDKLYLVFEKRYKIHVCTYNDWSWSAAQQLLSTGICHEPIVETDSQDYAHVIFSMRSSGVDPQIYYSTNKTGSWVTNKITNELAPIVDPAHATGPSDEIHVIWGTVYADHTDEDLEYDQYTGSIMPGTILEEQTGLVTPHPRLRLACDACGNLFAFVARRYPPKLRVREQGTWLDPIPLGASNEGFWFLEAVAYRNQVHFVYSNSDGAIKDVTYRKITGPCAYLSFVSLDLGPTDVEDGLSRVVVGDGDTVPAAMDGREARRNDDPSQDKYIYFDVDSLFAINGSNPDLYIKIDYYDTSTSTLTLQYDAIDGTVYKNGGAVTLTDTNTWKQHTFHVTDAYFGGRQNDGADFRIYGGGSGNTFYLDFVRVSDVPIVPPLIEEVTPDPGTAFINTEYNRQLNLIQGFPIPSWMVVQGPVGIKVDDSGRVSGWIPVAGDLGSQVTFEIQASNSEGSDTESWTAIIFSKADFNLDSDVDQEDFGVFQACLSGNTRPYEPGCESTDLDTDDDVDLADFGVFQSCLGGANRPPDPGCTG
jgi:hypothetical protein